jgi:hypothetical protein
MRWHGTRWLVGWRRSNSQSLIARRVARREFAEHGLSGGRVDAIDAHAAEYLGES